MTRLTLVDETKRASLAPASTVTPDLCGTKSAAPGCVYPGFVFTSRS